MSRYFFEIAITQKKTWTKSPIKAMQIDEIEKKKKRAWCSNLKEKEI